MGPCCQDKIRSVRSCGQKQRIRQNTGSANHQSQQIIRHLNSYPSRDRETSMFPVRSLDLQPLPSIVPTQVLYCRKCHTKLGFYRPWSLPQTEDLASETHAACLYANTTSSHLQTFDTEQGWGMQRPCHQGE